MTRSSSLGPLILQRESDHLLGKRRRGFFNLLILYFLLFLTLAAALGGLESLQQRMEDPFTQQVEVQLSTSDHPDPIIQYFSDSSRHGDLGITGIELVGIRHQYFRNVSEPVADMFRCLSFDPANSSLWKRIETDPELLVRGMLPLDPNDQCGVIATVESLERLGLDPKTAEHILWQDGVGYSGARDYALCLPVLAVVNDLPRECDMAMTVPMAGYLNNPNDTKFVELDARNGSLHMLVDDRSTASKITSSLNKAGVYPDNIREENFRMDDGTTQKKISLNLPDILDLDTRARLVDSINEVSLDSIQFMLTSETFCYTTNTPEIKREYLYFLFDRLDDIDRFNDTLYTQFGLQLDLTKVKSTENFASVAALTYTLTVMLFLFGLAGLAYHAHRQVREHLERSRKGIGTLAAFGLAPTALARIFLQVIMRAHILAALLALGLGFCLQGAFGLFPTGPRISFTHPLVWLALPLSWGVLALTVHTLVNKHLRHSPGDLIHGR